MHNSHTKSGRFSLTLPPTDGGLDMSAQPTAIADDRLADGNNVWWENGALRTRPGLYCDTSQSEVLYTNEELPDNVALLARTTPLSLTTTVDGVLTETVAEHWFRNGDKETVPMRVGHDGHAYPFQDKDGVDMNPLPLVYCLATNDASGNPLFFTQEGIVGIGTNSTDGTWVNFEEALYVPLLRVGGSGVTHSKKRVVTGNAFEAINLLTPRFRAQYTTDGVGKYYFLPQHPLDSQPIYATYRDGTGAIHTYVLDDDAAVSDAVNGLCLCANRDTGCVWFQDVDGDVVALGETGYGGNLEFEARTGYSARRQTILNMRIGVWFGGDTHGLSSGTRLFVAGNPDYPHLIHWSDVNNALYFPANNYAYVGDSTQAITALQKQEDILVIFKEREIFAASYQSTSITDDDILRGEVTDVTAQSAAFPLTPLAIGVGCDCPHTIRLCHNRLVWAHSDGAVYTLLGKSPYSERNVRKVSAPIARALTEIPHDEWAFASAATHKGWYLLLVGDTVWALHYDNPAFVRYTGYAADSTAQAHICWYRWSVALYGVFWQCILGDADRAVLYGITRADGITRRLLYTLDGTVDCVPTADGFTTAPIAFSLTTKAWDVGSGESVKDVTRIAVDASPSENTIVRIGVKDLQGNAWQSPPLCAAQGYRLLCGLKRAPYVQISVAGEGEPSIRRVTLYGNHSGEVK